MTIPPFTPLSYEGTSQPIQYINRTFAPLATNWQFTVPTIWVDTADEAAYILLAKPANAAVWRLFASSSGYWTWNDVQTTPIALETLNIYLVDDGSSTVTFTLPTSPAFGDTYRVVGYTGAWSVTTSGTQTIIFGSQTASTSLSSTLASDTVEISCIVADTTASVFKVTNSLGNLTII